MIRVRKNPNLLILALSACLAFGLFLAAHRDARDAVANTEAEMTRSRALAACRMHPQAMPHKDHGRNMLNYIRGEITLKAFLYAYNMYSSVNLPWINCMLEHAPMDKE